MIWLNRCINYISGQTTGLDHWSACSFPFWQCSLSWQQFPVWQWSIPRWYWQWSSSPQLSTILTVVSSLSDYSPQHSPHSYFHVIFISAYPAVRVKFYAYVNMLGRNEWFNKLTYYLLEREAVCKPATKRREETNSGTTQMTALVKGSLATFNDWAVPAYITA